MSVSALPEALHLSGTAGKRYRVGIFYRLVDVGFGIRLRIIRDSPYGYNKNTKPEKGEFSGFVVYAKIEIRIIARIKIMMIPAEMLH